MVLDTMIFSYAFFGRGQENFDSRAVLSKTPRILVPDSFYSEFTNTAWQWISHRNTPKVVALNALEDIDRLVTQIIETKSISRVALDLALEKNHSVYDSLFVATAIEFDTKVISYDKKLLRDFPEFVIKPRAYLNKIN